MNIPVLAPCVVANQRKNIFLQIQIGKIAQNKSVGLFKARAGQGIGILANYLKRHHTVRVYHRRCLFKVVRRNLDDTEAEILFERTLSERKEALHIKIHEASRQEPARGNLMGERAAIRLTPRNDHRVDGVPKAIVDEDPTRRVLIASLTKQVS